jgi:hypothetical protein
MSQVCIYRASNASGLLDGRDGRVVGWADPDAGSSVIATPSRAPSGAPSDNVDTLDAQRCPPEPQPGPNFPSTPTLPTLFRPGGRKTHDQVWRPLSGYDNRRARVRICARWRERDHSGIRDARERALLGICLLSTRADAPKATTSRIANTIGTAAGTGVRRNSTTQSPQLVMPGTRAPRCRSTIRVRRSAGGSTFTAPTAAPPRTAPLGTARDPARSART